MKKSIKCPCCNKEITHTINKQYMHNSKSVIEYHCPKCGFHISDDTVNKLLDTKHFEYGGHI